MSWAARTATAWFEKGYGYHTRHEVEGGILLLSVVMAFVCVDLLFQGWLGLLVAVLVGRTVLRVAVTVLAHRCYDDGRPWQ